MSERINQVRGPLSINGGIVQNNDRFLNNPFRLPGETNWFVPDGFIDDFKSVTVDGVDYAALTYNNITHVSPDTGLTPGFDPRMNDNQYIFTILDGPARATELEVLKIDPTDPYTVIFKTPYAELQQTPDLTGTTGAIAVDARIYATSGSGDFELNLRPGG